MTKLDKFIRPKSKVENTVRTSINIDRTHLEFLKRLDINLSSLVRDVLTKLIEENIEDSKLL